MKRKHVLERALSSLFFSPFLSSSSSSLFLSFFVPLSLFLSDFFFSRCRGCITGLVCKLMLPWR